MYIYAITKASVIFQTNDANQSNNMLLDTLPTNPAPNWPNLARLALVQPLQVTLDLVSNLANARACLHEHGVGVYKVRDHTMKLVGYSIEPIRRRNVTAPSARNKKPRAGKMRAPAAVQPVMERTSAAPPPPRHITEFDVLPTKATIDWEALADTAKTRPVYLRPGSISDVTLARSNLHKRGVGIYAVLKGEETIAWAVETLRPRTRRRSPLAESLWQASQARLLRAAQAPDVIVPPLPPVPPHKRVAEPTGVIVPPPPPPPRVRPPVPAPVMPPDLASKMAALLLVDD